MSKEQDLLNDKKIENISFMLAEYAQKAIMYEAVLTPKPGLVDSVDCGAHKDMDIFTFLDSSANLYRGFYEYSKAGLLSIFGLEELFREARNIGVAVEMNMFLATKNVNTHKGINFSMGIVLIAVGYYISTTKHESSRISDDILNTDIMSREDEILIFSEQDSDRLMDIIKTMLRGLVQRDFKDLNKKKVLTNGERLYLERGFSGIRGEAENGFPTVMDIALPRLRALSNANISIDRKLLDVLFHIMSVSEDSNIVYRGGLEALDYVKKQAAEFLEAGGVFNDDYKDIINDMNMDFVNKNLSPGGSADLLSITLFFAFLENLI